MPFGFAFLVVLSGLTVVLAVVLFFYVRFATRYSHRVRVKIQGSQLELLPEIESRLGRIQHEAESMRHLIAG